ncbi:hypothetical protein CPter91_4545 [Collimonas pratensis]|uniref:Uncharacterized protein n=1 Tax=Collimonas pratensis TaxID=279113 RepID=A0A127QA34_9BURK|nr:hypothetical protein CPter91_4545 [Collimonas pratensis]
MTGSLQKAKTFSAAQTVNSIGDILMTIKSPETGATFDYPARGRGKRDQPSMQPV